MAEYVITDEQLEDIVDMTIVERDKFWKEAISDYFKGKLKEDYPDVK